MSHYRDNYDYDGGWCAAFALMLGLIAIAVGFLALLVPHIAGK